MVTPLPNKREKGSLACMEADGKVSSGLLYKAMIKSKIHVSSFSLVKEMRRGKKSCFIDKKFREVNHTRFTCRFPPKKLSPGDTLMLDGKICREPKRGSS